jgi:hypothetical protein
MKTIVKVINTLAMIAVFALMIYDFNAFATGTADSYLLGVSAVICASVFVIFLLVDVLTRDEDEDDITKGGLREIESDFITERAILDIDTDKPFVVKTAIKARMLIKNIAEAPGLRLKFASVLTVLSPDDIELHITPGETTQISVNIIPLSKGKHEVFVDFCNLDDGMCLSVQKFEFSAREQLVAGLTTTQMNTVKNLLKLGVFVAVGTGLLFTFVPELQDFQDIVTAFIPLLIIGQALAVYYFSALLNRLPQV